MKILLVDDNTSLRNFSAEVLTAAGHRVESADDGTSALRAFERLTPEEESFDLLISDYDMPGLDGLALCDRLRARRADLPVLIISSLCGSGTLAHRRDVACLSKPFSQQQLLDALPRAMEPIREVSVPPSAGPDVPRPGARGWPLALSVAAMLALVVAVSGFEVRNLLFGAPSLPDPAAVQVSRSTHLQVSSPQGVLPSLPSEARWDPVDGAQEYLVTFESIDGRPLFTSTHRETQWPLPIELRQVLVDHVAYHWQVEAVDASGNVIARSPKTRFRVLPPVREDAPRLDPTAAEPSDHRPTAEVPIVGDPS